MPAARSRAGARLLSLFAAPLNALVLDAHADRPMRLGDLHKRLGASQSTLREYLTGLVEFGALVKQDLERTPRAVATALTNAGREMLLVAGVIEEWLERAPGGRIALDSEQGKAAVKALVGGWDSRILGFLAAGPLSLTELDGLIADVSYPALERRLAAMRTRGLIEVVPASRPGTFYTVTEWARQAVTPLAAAIRCEHRDLQGDSGPITAVEVEAAFLLALPLISLLPESRGAWLLAVDLGDPDDPSGNHQLAVRVEVENGRVSSIARPEPAEPMSLPRIQGQPLQWLDAIVDGSFQGLYGDRDPRLPITSSNGTHSALFHV